MNELGEEAGLSSGGTIIPQTFIFKKKKRDVSLETIVVETETSSSIVLLQELARGILSRLERFYEMTNTGEHFNAILLKRMLQTFFDSQIKRFSEGRSSSASILQTLISYDDIVVFGMTESTARRLWENEDDEVWDDL